MRGEEIDLVEIIKRSFKSLFREPGFIGLYLIPYVVILFAAVHIWLAYRTLDPSALAQIVVTVGFVNFLKEWIVWIVIYAIAFLVLFISAEAAIILKAGARAKEEVMSVGTAFSRGIGYFPRLLVAGILAGLIAMGGFFGFLALAIAGVLIGGVTGGTMIGIGVIGCIIFFILAIYLAVRLALYAQSCVLEEEGCVGCLKRSWGLTKGNFWLIFVLMLLFSIISIVIGLIPVVGSLVGTLFVGPAVLIAYTFLFLEIRKASTEAPL